MLVALIGVLLYVNQVVVPATPPFFVPTTTPTTSPESFVNQAQAVRTKKASWRRQSRPIRKPSTPIRPTRRPTSTLARMQVFAGDYEDAVLNAQNALLKNPSNPLAHAVQAWALSFLGKSGEAEIEIKKALDLDPNNALAHAYYAEILINEKDPDLQDKAIEESRIARDLDPSLLETHRVRGIVLYNTSNPEEAIQEFQAALAINKNIADIHLYLGVTYKAMEDYQKAEESLLAAYALNPTDPVALTEISRAYFADGRYGQAAQYAEEAVKVIPNDPRLHGNLGIMYYKTEDYAKAIPELALAVRGGTTADGQAVEGLPLDYGRIEEYYLYYGFALAKSDRCPEAIPVAQALISGVPDSDIAVYNANAILQICLGGGTETPETTPEATATP